VAMIAAGGVLAIPAFVVILHAIVLLLSNFMRDWIAGLLVGLVVAAVAALLARKGVNDLSANRLAPERTAANIKRDVHLVQEKVS
jgi:apolipoprotein N-acyltransferase